MAGGAHYFKLVGNHINKSRIVLLVLLEMLRIASIADLLSSVHITCLPGILEVISAAFSIPTDSAVKMEQKVSRMPFIKMFPSSLTTAKVVVSYCLGMFVKMNRQG